MLSVFCKKLSTVEIQLEQHTKIIGELQVMLDVDDETGQRKLKVDNGWVSLRRLMADVQTHISRMDSRLDELGSQLDQNDAAICDLRSRLAWCRGTEGAGGGGGKGGGADGGGRGGIRGGGGGGGHHLLQGGDDGNHDNAADFLSIPRMTSTAQALDWIRAQATAGLGVGPGSGPSAASGGSTHAAEIEETCRRISSQPDQTNQTTTTGSLHHTHYHSNQSQDPAMSNQSAPNGQLNRNACQSYADSVRSRPTGTDLVREDPPIANKVMQSKPCRDEETTETGRSDDTTTFCSGKSKERMKVLHEEIQKRDTIIQDLMANHEHLTRKEKEIAKKEEWYEHKMRLLKQDKRRRGETIGKLLRCLDDMKDQGRLDETRVTDGRLVLAATINSRGLSMEDRIFAAVEAMETERAAQRAQAAAEAAEELQMDAEDDVASPGPTTYLESFQPQWRFTPGGVARPWSTSQ